MTFRIGSQAVLAIVRKSQRGASKKYGEWGKVHTSGSLRSSLVAQSFLWAFGIPRSLAASSALAALGIERLILVALAPANETIHFVCIVRLLAYGLIIWAIVDKNRSIGSGSSALAERLDQSVKRCECKLAASAGPTFTSRSSALGRARSARSFAV